MQLICGLFGHWPEPGRRGRRGRDHHKLCVLCQRGVVRRDQAWTLADEAEPAPRRPSGS